MVVGGAPEQARVKELTYTVVEIWAEVLEVDQSTIDPQESDFFAMGGYSLLVLQAISRLLEKQGVDEEQAQELEGILLNELFENPTAAAQAECLLRSISIQA